jgi:DNA-binding FadR family transcriptional regulator
MITPIVAKRKFEVVSEQIIEMIKSGEYPEGGRIPAEAELADSFGVGRGSVREAIKSLQLQGILNSGAGKGTFVAPGALTCISNNELSEEILREDAVVHLIESRLILEPGIAAAVAERRNQKDLRLLYDSIRDMQKSQTRSEIMEHGQEFHHALVKMCGNPILIKLYQTIDGQLHRLRLMDFVTFDIYRRGIEEHRKIAQAIERRDAGDARRLMYQHIATDYRQYLPPTVKK